MNSMTSFRSCERTLGESRRPLTTTRMVGPPLPSHPAHHCFLPRIAMARAARRLARTSRATKTRSRKFLPHKGAQPSKATPPPPKSGTRVSDLRPPPKKAGGSLAKPPPVPASGSGVKHPPKVKAGAQTAKAAARRDPEAPNHMGHPNAAGELYPGFPVGHPKRCEACDQLRRGFLRFTKGHRKPVCEWAPLQAKRQS